MCNFVHKLDLKSHTLINLWKKCFNCRFICPIWCVNTEHACNFYNKKHVPWHQTHIWFEFRLGWSTGLLIIFYVEMSSILRNVCYGFCAFSNRWLLTFFFLVSSNEVLLEHISFPWLYCTLMQEFYRNVALAPGAISQTCRRATKAEYSHVWEWPAKCCNNVFNSLLSFWKIM